MNQKALNALEYPKIIEKLTEKDIDIIVEFMDLQIAMCLL